MEETLAFLEKEIEAFEKILAELSGGRPPEKKMILGDMEDKTEQDRRLEDRRRKVSFDEPDSAPLPSPRPENNGESVSSPPIPQSNPSPSDLRKPPSFKSGPPIPPKPKTPPILLQKSANFPSTENSAKPAVAVKPVKLRPVVPPKPSVRFKPRADEFGTEV